MQVSYHTPVAFATHVSKRETPPTSAAPIITPSTKRAYTGLADYAQAHGLTAAAMQRWQWQQTIYQDRPALQFLTQGGTRYRFLDGQEPTYKSKFGFKRSWYGLDNDLIESIDDETPLVICNGEVSTVTAQTYLIPAVCITSGEKGRIPQNLLDELIAAIPGASILIAPDCDPTGTRAAAGMLAQLNAAGFKARAVDLGLSDGGDLADFCMLHGAAAYERLKQCALLDMPESAAPTFTPRVMPSASTSTPANASPEAEERRRAHFDKRWNGAISALERTTSGRWHAAFTHACLLFDLVYSYGYRSESEARTAIENACEINGYRADHGAQMVKAQINGALNQPRQTLDVYEYDNPAPRRQNPSWAEKSDYSPIGETAPMLTDVNLSHARAIPDTLPRALIEIGLKVWGLSIVAEIAYLLYAIAHKLLPSFFTLKDRNEASDTPADKNIFTEMLDMGILIEVSSELIPQMPHISKDTWGKQRINSAGRKEKVYRLATLAELKRLIFQPLARSLALDSVESDQLPIIDETVKPLVRYVLEKLVTWNAPLKNVNIGIVRYCLKKADKHRDAEVLEAIRVLRITDAAFLGAMGLEAAQTAAAAYFSHVDEETARLIDLKNQLLTRQYQTYKKSLANPVITPLPEGVPSTAQAWQNAHNNALLKPHNGGYLWPHELCEVMGIEDKKTAKRTAARAGITIGETRFDVRAFTVETKHDYKPSWEEIVIAGKKAIEHEDKALDGRVRVWGPVQMHSVIKSYDDAGRLVAKGYVSEADEPDDWRIGGTHFTIECELRPLITVSDAAPLVATIEADEPEESADMMPDEMLIDESLDDEAIRQIAAFIALVRELHRAGRRRRASQRHESNRITPGRLRDDDWMLHRLLASYCFNAEKGVFYNPLTGEMHETQDAAVNDLMGIVKPSELQEVS